MIQKIKIPLSRIAVLIGTHGSIRRKIEKSLNITMTVKDDISIEGDALNVMDATNIVTAIGRGFSPENALKLLDEDVTLSIIDLPKDSKKLERLKSRIIGEKGRARENIERLTDTHISVYGKTVAIIGNYESVKDVTDAIEMFIKGYSHRAIYAFLERQRVRNKINL